jgi:hypothetical protein
MQYKSPMAVKAIRLAAAIAAAACAMLVELVAAEQFRARARILIVAAVNSRKKSRIMTSFRFGALD